MKYEIRSRIQNTIESFMYIALCSTALNEAFELIERDLFKLPMASTTSIYNKRLANRPECSIFNNYCKY